MRRRDSAASVGATSGEEVGGWSDMDVYIRAINLNRAEKGDGRLRGKLRAHRLAEL